MKAVMIILALGMFVQSSMSADFYVAPEGVGNKDGTSAKDAAEWISPELWAQVASSLENEPVVVNLLAGTYLVGYSTDEGKWKSLSLEGIGNEKNLLTVTGADNRKTIIRRGKNESSASDTCPSLLSLEKSRNILIRNLYFTGPEKIGYVLSIRESRDITIEKCVFKDLTGTYYAASGARNGSENITWKELVCENVGVDAHCHMLYNADKCRNLKIQNCFFSDVPGDYVRFRNQCNDVLVENCTFKSTGRYGESPFISFSLFIDVSSGSGGSEEQQEYFENNAIIRDNKFMHKSVMAQKDHSYVLLFHHSGFNPPGKSHLWSNKDISALKKMNKVSARKWIEDKTGIDLDSFHVYRNKISNASEEAVYESKPCYGAEKEFPVKSYKTSFVVSKLLNREPVK